MPDTPDNFVEDCPCASCEQDRKIAASHTAEVEQLKAQVKLFKEQAEYWQRRTKEMEDGWKRAAHERDELENQLINLQEQTNGE